MKVRRQHRRRGVEVAEKKRGASCTELQWWMVDGGWHVTLVTETSAPELPNLLFWLMVVGYNIRNIEVFIDMERMLDAQPNLPELPPGENV
ncbi:hypothetical protein MUK42_27480 [Musa troglodytarum]|uniref:Uncharacterized protein n=1 Tax=Musa troglodytarum TaxID=320322 RepID=A0A9E7EQR9_9LILI|nr:hypothetical protein MUK42_09350 [Musa troglodytarum]URD82204.1 hypothetical protein MUK42_27480 [Musa troglodytarum]